MEIKTYISLALEGGKEMKAAAAKVKDAVAALENALSELESCEFKLIKKQD
jgi:hypothetical protein